MRSVWLAAAVVSVVLLCVAGAGLARAEEALLKYDDGQVDGKQSFGGAAHVIWFEAPEGGPWFVDRVEVCASQYGGNYDPATTMCRAYICDAQMKPLGEAQAPYQTFPRAREQQWGSIPVPRVPVSGKFFVVVAPGSLQTRGLFVAYDKTGKTSENLHSGVGTPGQAPKPPRQPWDWMIRAHLTTEKPAEAAPGAAPTVMAWDDGTAEDKQSFGGSTGMGVRLKTPEGKWLVDAVQIYGGAYGSGQDQRQFTVGVYDDQMKPLSVSQHPYNLFTSDMHWVRVDVFPDVTVSGIFHVVYVGNCTQTEGIFLGIDTTKGSGQSFLGGRQGVAVPWDFRLPQNAMNWMIRAELKPAQ